MLAVAGLFLVFGLLARKLQAAFLTGPLVFTIGGYLVAFFMVEQLAATEQALHWIAEVTLILLLFGDAATIAWSELRRNVAPVRLLLIGLPLTMLLGSMVGTWLFPTLGLWGAALLAAILTPTDAALAQPLVTNDRVPEQIRETIIVESGLNDGIALPVVLVTASCLVMMGQGDLLPQLRVGLWQILLAPPIGAAVGFLGGRAINFSVERGWTEPSFDHFGGPSLAIIAFSLAHVFGANGFIAAFVAGLLFGNACEAASERLRQFDQQEGEVLSYITFFLFGSLLLKPTLEQISWLVVLYALLSLTVVRMLPVFLSLIGSPLPLRWKLALGWFGPRGLASILFVLLVLRRHEIPQNELILTVVSVTVAVSVLLHGVTAGPLARRFHETSSQTRNH